MSAPQFLDHTDSYGTRRIAMLAQPGAGPAIIWLGGFRSDMRATKAEALARFASERGQAYLRFDYSGHGESHGDFADGTISQWLGDALAVITNHGGNAPVLVGSSMGGWLALLAAKALRTLQSASAPSALVLIAPAVDFTQTLMWDSFPQDIRDQIMREGVWMRPSAYAPEPTPISRALIEDGRKHLMFGSTIDPCCPVTILQGMMDPDVPWQQAMTLVEHLPQSDVTLTLIKNGDHRLSSDEDIARLKQAVAGALERART
jgi:pimeloyl-ACP methyl ester carboxylesterase